MNVTKLVKSFYSLNAQFWWKLFLNHWCQPVLGIQDILSMIFLFQPGSPSPSMCVIVTEYPKSYQSIIGPRKSIMSRVYNYSAKREIIRPYTDHWRTKAGLWPYRDCLLCPWSPLRCFCGVECINIAIIGDFLWWANCPPPCALFQILNPPHGEG